MSGAQPAHFCQSAARREHLLGRARPGGERVAARSFDGPPTELGLGGPAVVVRQRHRRSRAQIRPFCRADGDDRARAQAHALQRSLDSLTPGCGFSVERREQGARVAAFSRFADPAVTQPTVQLELVGMQTQHIDHRQETGSVTWLACETFRPDREGPGAAHEQAPPSAPQAFGLG